MFIFRFNLCWCPCFGDLYTGSFQLLPVVKRKVRICDWDSMLFVCRLFARPT